MLEPYADLPASAGLNTTSISTIQQSAQLAVKHNFQLCVHAIGDRANREVLNIFEETASMQGVHCTSEGVFVTDRLGVQRAKQGAYVWRSLLDSGAVVINGTDAPVETVDPLACNYASVI